MKKNTKNNIYYKYITYENIYEMWKIIKKTCKNKDEVYSFSLNLNTNLYKIYNELKNINYKPNKFNPFMIFEPKPRLVMSQKIKDKIVNHFVTNFYLLPILDKSLINSNVATRINKGSGYADKLLKKYLNSLLTQNKEIYCLKVDISKYFYTIDHEILINKLKRKIKDNNVIEIVKTIIKETNNDYINEEVKRYNKIYNLDTPYYINNKGLSIGSDKSVFSDLLSK